MNRETLHKRGKDVRRLLTVTCPVVVTMGLAAQLFTKINHYAVNILFSDLWDTYDPLFHDYSVWQSFTLQHGPIRLGVGALVSEAVAVVTGWNTRTEAFVVGFIVLLTAVAALFLKWRLFKKITVWDSLIPMMFLGPAQVATSIVVPFPAYSAVPLFLLLMYGLCLTCRSQRLRFGGLAFLNFLLVFTCWGIFVGFLTPFLVT